MHRRSLLALLGLGSGAAASGVGPGALASSAGFAFPPHPNYPMEVPMVGESPAWSPADEARFITKRRDALGWLTANGLPDYVRAKIRYEAEQQAATANEFPPEIEALRSFSAPAKRRLYVEMLVRRGERDTLAQNYTNLTTEIARRTIPEAFRDMLRWF